MEFVRNGRMEWPFSASVRAHLQAVCAPAIHHVIYRNRARKHGVRRRSAADDGAILLSAGLCVGAVSRLMFLHSLQ